MKHSLLALCCVLLAPLTSSCAMDGGDDEVAPVGSVQEDLGGKTCETTLDCSKDKRCTTEIGDCNDPPSRCAHDPASCGTCYGTCRPLELCGPVTCGEGEVCCDADCGVCTLPGEACICDPPGEVLPG